MNQISDIMIRDVRSIAPNVSLQVAAQKMNEFNVSALPVCEGDKLIGMVTDHDITVRGVAMGKKIDSTPVTDVMSEHVQFCFEDELYDDVMQKMHEVLESRRIPVIDRNHHLIGMFSLDKLTSKACKEEEIKDTLG